MEADMPALEQQVEALSLSLGQQPPVARCELYANAAQLWGELSAAPPPPPRDPDGHPCPVRQMRARAAEVCAEVLGVAAGKDDPVAARAYHHAAAAWGGAGDWEQALRCATLGRRLAIALTCDGSMQEASLCSAAAVDAAWRCDDFAAVTRLLKDDSAGLLHAAEMAAACGAVARLQRERRHGELVEVAEHVLRRAPADCGAGVLTFLFRCAAEAYLGLGRLQEACDAAAAAVQQSSGAVPAAQFDAAVMLCVTAAEAAGDDGQALRDQASKAVAQHAARGAAGLIAAGRALARNGHLEHAEAVLAACPGDEQNTAGQRALFDVLCARAGLPVVGPGGAGVGAAPSTEGRAEAAEKAVALLSAVEHPRCGVWRGAAAVARAAAWGCGKGFAQVLGRVAGRCGDAVRWLGQAQRFAAHGEEARLAALDYAEALSADGRHDEAAEALREAAKRRDGGDSPRGCMTAAALQLRRGDHDGALGQLGGLHACGRAALGRCLCRATALARLACLAGCPAAAVAALVPCVTSAVGADGADPTQLVLTLRSAAECLAQEDPDPAPPEHPRRRQAPEWWLQIFGAAAKLLGVVDKGARIAQGPLATPEEQVGYVMRRAAGERAAERLLPGEARALFGSSGAPLSESQWFDLVRALVPDAAPRAVELAVQGLSEDMVRRVYDMRLARTTLAQDAARLWRQEQLEWWSALAWKQVQTAREECVAAPASSCWARVLPQLVSQANQLDGRVRSAAPAGSQLLHSEPETAVAVAAAAPRGGQLYCEALHRAVCAHLSGPWGGESGLQRGLQLACLLAREPHPDSLLWLDAELRLFARAVQAGEVELTEDELMAVEYLTARAWNETCAMVFRSSGAEGSRGAVCAQALAAVLPDGSAIGRHVLQHFDAALGAAQALQHGG
eukprot:TRINITY_DN50651_c0_g1_i1.p1 TRINITY_DN50651_c0_g1~~TRINITY_DN50651_c0_g1_i1.p1  ORF type:complete len:941 (+),score=292.24 TRINITY_DN50651_c0_g1_i1:109-2823(+)